MTLAIGLFAAGQAWSQENPPLLKAPFAPVIERLDVHGPPLPDKTLGAELPVTFAIDMDAAALGPAAHLFPPYQNASWLSYGYDVMGSPASQSGRAEIQVVDLLTPTRTMTERFLRRLFPRLEVVETTSKTLPPPGLVFKIVTPTLELIQKGREFTMVARLLVNASGGGQSLLFAGLGYASVPASPSWKGADQGLTQARSALEQAFAQLFDNIAHDPRLAALVAYMNARRLPAVAPAPPPAAHP